MALWWRKPKTDDAPPDDAPPDDAPPGDAPPDVEAEGESRPTVPLLALPTPFSRGHSPDAPRWMTGRSLPEPTRYALPDGVALLPTLTQEAERPLVWAAWCDALPSARTHLLALCARSGEHSSAQYGALARVLHGVMLAQLAWYSREGADPRQLAEYGVVVLGLARLPHAERVLALAEVRAEMPGIPLYLLDK